VAVAKARNAQARERMAEARLPAREPTMERTTVFSEREDVVMSGRVQEARRITQPKRSSRPDSTASARDTQDASPRVASNLRRLRLRRGLSVEGLAHASGVEREELDQIELERGQPTIKVLWSLANALEVPFSALLAPEPDGNLESDLVTGPASGTPDSLVCRPVLPSRQGPRRTEVYQLTLLAHGSRVAAPRPALTTDSLLVTGGSVTIDVGDARHELKTGDSLEFRSDVERTYRNSSEREATMYVVITYADQQG
jgi:transcriptional regulator with XRE-family HTH domain